MNETFAENIPHSMLLISDPCSLPFIIAATMREGLA
jgi:hypothetical protein